METTDGLGDIIFHNVERLCHARAISISDAAHMCAMTGRSFRSFLSGSGSYIGLNLLLRIASGLDCSVDYLLGRYDPIQNREYLSDRR